MKKFCFLFLSGVLIFALTACGQTVKEVQTDSPVIATSAIEDESSAAEAGTEAQGFLFTYNGVDIQMNVPADDILKALGEPKNYSEETSCAFEGLDKTYFYGSFYLQTYPKGDQEMVYSLWLVDDSISTNDGLYIGMSQEEAESILGADSYNGTSAYEIHQADSVLTVIVDNGQVSSIQYITDLTA